MSREAVIVDSVRTALAGRLSRACGVAHLQQDLGASLKQAGIHEPEAQACAQFFAVCKLVHGRRQIGTQQCEPAG